MAVRASHHRAPVRRGRGGGRGGRRGGRRAAAGFTLVELMVVITVIGLAAAVAAFAMPDPRGRVVDEGLRFASRVRAARDLAIVDGRPVSLWVTSGGYGFDQRTGGAWAPVVAKPLRVASWADETRAAIADPSGRTRVVFDPTGAADRALELRLSRGEAAAVVWIGADGQVRADAQ